MRRKKIHRLIWAALMVGAAMELAAWATAPGGNLTVEEWTEAVRQRGVDPATVENPLEFNDEMQAFARAAGKGVGVHERLENLQRELFLKYETPFGYDPHGTLTAREAFATRRGNCVAFTNLFIAMARSMGIRVQPALVERRGEVERDGDLMVVNNHVVAIYRHSEGTTLFDFFRTRREELGYVKPIDDLWSAAIYLNNLGVRALRDGDAEAAIPTLEKALRLAPRYAAIYGNLGVALRRRGDDDAALDSYILGMHIEPRNDALRNNAHALLVKRAGQAESEPTSDPAGSPRTESWNHRARRELAQGRIGRALRLFRRVHRADPDRSEPLISIARCELIRGRLPAARRALGRALAVQPDDATADRLMEALNRAEPPRVR